MQKIPTIDPKHFEGDRRGQERRATDRRQYRDPSLLAESELSFSHLEFINGLYDLLRDGEAFAAAQEEELYNNLEAINDSLDAGINCFERKDGAIVLRVSPEELYKLLQVMRDAADKANGVFLSSKTEKDSLAVIKAQVKEEHRRDLEKISRIDANIRHALVINNGGEELSEYLSSAEPEVRSLYLVESSSLREQDALITQGNPEVEFWARKSYDTDITRIIKEAILHGKSTSTTSLLFLDIDNFKPVNDTKGHDFGDQVIRDTGLQIYSIVNEILLPYNEASVQFYHYGGDEFAIIIKDFDKIEELRSNLEERMLEFYISQGLRLKKQVKQPSPKNTIIKKINEADQTIQSFNQRIRNFFERLQKVFNIMTAKPLNVGASVSAVSLMDLDSEIERIRDFVQEVDIQINEYNSQITRQQETGDLYDVEKEKELSLQKEKIFLLIKEYERMVEELKNTWTRSASKKMKEDKNNKKQKEGVSIYRID